MISRKYREGFVLEKLSDLPNVGKVLLRRLAEIGVDTPAQLREIGAREAFLRIRAHDPGACLHMLCGIEGAIRGIRDKDLPQETRDHLKEFFRTLPGESSGTASHRV